MKHNIVFENVREADKIAICLSNIDSEPSLKNIIRYTKTNCTSKSQFIQNCKDIAYSENAKKIIYGLTQNFQTFTVADDFDTKGKVIWKHLNQMVSAHIKNLNIMIYPDGSITNSDFYKVSKTQNYWEDAEAIEGDFASLTWILIATKECTEKTKVKIDIRFWENNYIDQLDEIVKYCSFERTNTVDSNTVLITDRVINDQFVREFDGNIKPVIVSVSCFSTSYTEKDFIKELSKKQIHVIPSYFVNIGSNILAEGLAIQTRSIQDSFQLMPTIKDKAVKFWTDALNYRINFYDVCYEILENHYNKTPNRFRQIEQGVGVMTLKV